MPAWLEGGSLDSWAMSVDYNTNQTNVHKEQGNLPLDPNRSRVEINQLRYEVDLFPDQSIIDPIDKDQEERIMSAAQKMQQSAQESSFPAKHWKGLQHNVYENPDHFRVIFSPLKIKLNANAEPVKVR